MKDTSSFSELPQIARQRIVDREPQHHPTDGQWREHRYGHQLKRVAVEYFQAGAGSVPAEQFRIFERSRGPR